MAYRSSLNILFSVIGSLLPTALNFKGIIIVDGIVTFLSLLLVIPVKENYKGTSRVTLKISSFKILGKLSTEAIIGLGAGVLLPMLSLWFNLRFHVTASSLSPIYAISEITLALSTLFSPILASTLGRIRAILTFSPPWKGDGSPPRGFIVPTINSGLHLSSGRQTRGPETPSRLNS
ncbi:hypothetical protein YG5714_2348 [Sulfolobus islandicus Y.G.57.14]|uniref:Uncharacterized protein n=1 Tax=Saccharolobus islandicus (strain Y.G.57.14 / Yellowstone \|nr:hypothetical protein YG5714_2348 [Sulfolobus islandicus Y.G.57.14]